MTSFRERLQAAGQWVWDHPLKLAFMIAAPLVCTVSIERLNHDTRRRVCRSWQPWAGSSGNEALVGDEVSTVDVVRHSAACDPG